MSESVEQTLQLDDLAFQLRAYVGIGNEHAPVRHLNDIGGAADVETFLYGVGSTCERLVLNKLEAAAAAVCMMGLAGEIAWANMQPGDGNSTYRNRIIDAIFNMTGDALEEGAKYELR